MNFIYAASLALFFLVAQVGCTTAHFLGDGRYAVTQVSEERSPFGTNAGFSRLAECGRRKNPDLQFNPLADSYTYDVECSPLTNWTPIQSQGQGGQIVQGALTGIGLGVLGATMPASGSASSSSAITTTTVTAPAKGHH